MILAMPDDIPLIITSNILAEELATLVLMTVVVAMDPPMLDVNVLDELVRVLLVLRLITDRLVVVALVNVGVSVKEYVTFPLPSVDTVKLLFVEDAIKLYRLLTDVVAITPLIIVVNTPLEAVIEFELIIDVVVDTPFIDEVRVFTADDKMLLSTKLAVVVAMTPLTTEVSTNELVDVEILRV